MTATALPDPPLRADGIGLRPLDWRDIDPLVEACNDPVIAEYIPVPSPYTKDDARAYAAITARGFESGDNLQFAVVDEDGRLLGSCGLNHASEGRQTIEIGYWVAPWARRRGVATAAVRLLAGWALGALGFERVELYAAVDNVASRRVAVKAGFTEEGYLRARERTRGGQRRDMLVYSLLADEVPVRA